MRWSLEEKDESAVGTERESFSAITVEPILAFCRASSTAENALKYVTSCSSTRCTSILPRNLIILALLIVRYETPKDA